MYPAPTQPVTQELTKTPPPAAIKEFEPAPQAATENTSTVTPTQSQKNDSPAVEKVPISDTPAELVKPRQEDFELGEKVFRNWADSSNVYPSEETWRREFLARRTSTIPIPPSVLEELWLASDASGRKPLPKPVGNKQESPGPNILAVAPKTLYLIGAALLFLGVIMVLWMFRDVDFNRGDPQKVSSLMATMFGKSLLASALLAWTLHGLFGKRKGYPFLVFAITWAVIMAWCSITFREGLNASRSKSQVEHNQVTTLASNLLEYAQNGNGASLDKLKAPLTVNNDSIMTPIMEFARELAEAVEQRDQAMAGLLEKNIYDLTLLTSKIEMESEMKKRRRGQKIVEAFKTNVAAIIETTRRRFDHIVAPEKEKLAILHGFEQSINEKVPERESSYRLLSAQQRNEYDYLQFMVDSFKSYQIKDGTIYFSTDEALAGYNSQLKTIDNTEREMADLRKAMLNSTKQTAEQLLK